MDYATVELETMKFEAVSYVSEKLCDFAGRRTMRLTEHEAFYLDQVCLHIRQEILGRQLEYVDVRYPADWWQAFKDRWYPEWAKKRWPVRETVTFLIARELYPSMAMPDRNPVLNLERLTREWKAYNETH